jgi:FlaA1/EpsC-like NDP-sugar epimerase
LGDYAQSLLLLPNITPFIMLLCISGIYRTFWLRVGIIQYYRLVRLLVFAGIACYIINSILCLYLFNVPRNEMGKIVGFYMVFFLLTVSLIIIERFMIHFYESFGYRRLFIRNQGKDSVLTRVLIYGGGLFCRLYITKQFCGFKNNRKAIKIIGIMDDAPALRKLNVYGFEVMGAIHELNMIFAKCPFDIIVVTCGDVTGEKMQILKNFCRKNNIALQEFICCENNVELE